jgi:Pla-1/cef family extracellular lipase
MKKINSIKTTVWYSFIPATAILLASCGGGNSSSLVINSVVPGADDPDASRINFDAGAGDIPLPSDLLFSGTSDGTLELPDEVAGRSAGSIDYGNPGVALGGNDGWSTIVPIQIGLTMAENATIDATTVGASTVVMIETVTPPLDGTGAGCIPVEPFVSLSPGQPCGVVAPLTYGVDFVAVAGEDSITVAPLQPLKPKTTYVLGILDGVLDSRGESILGSTQYEQVTRGDIDIDFASLDSLQDAVNLYEVMIDFGTGGNGSAPADALYSSAWTTTSVGDAVATATTLLAAAPPTITGVSSAGVNVEELFVALGFLDAAALGTTASQFADLYSGALTLPYYSGHPDDGSDPITDNWRAMCDNPLVIAGAAALGALPAANEPNNTICQTINPALGDYGLDTERHLTKYNPIPLTRTTVDLEVQITVPNAVAGPWPVVMMQHGITADKEGLLAISGALAAAGFATFAIDHPLHGSRGLVSEALGGAEVNAGTDATAYMNLSYLLVTRDNEQQSIADMLGLRMAIGTGIAGDLTSADFDTSNVHFLGMSLGGISGTGFTTLANSLGLGLDIQSSALSVPGGGLAALLIESPSFSSLIQGSILAGAGLDLSSDFIAFIGANTPCAGDIACNFNDFAATLDATSLGIISGAVGAFGFAAQTITDAADPINFAASLAALGTPIYMNEVVGDGINNLPDQTIPNQTVIPGFTFGGTEPLAAFLGLSGVDVDNAPQASGIVRFTDGSHGSLLSPAASLGVTTEMQTQVATFFAAGVISITDATDVLDLP